MYRLLGGVNWALLKEGILLVSYSLDVVSVQVVRLFKGGTVKGEDFIGEVYIRCSEWTGG